MKLSKRILVAIIILLVISVTSILYIYTILFNPIVKLNKSSAFLYIKTDSRIEQVIQQCYNQNILTDTQDLKYAIKLIRFKKVFPGRYEVKNNMSSYQLINLLKSGQQKAINLTFSSIRFKAKFVQLIASKLEVDTNELYALLNDSIFWQSRGLNLENSLTVFIPNTYQFYWNTSAKEFVERMLKENKKFWSTKRITQAQKINLSPTEVYILASIVQEETNKKDEMSRIAGVYLNRLNKNMLLQADPTARFAYGDFAVKRITFDYIRYDSPYNTYLYKGLPPGPICLANPQTIDKVLEAEAHKYLYFCAKPDFSGYHNFAVNGEQHSINARNYHKFLNKNKVY